MGPFDSAWLKCAWAVRHSSYLEADIKRFRQDPKAQPSISVRAEYQPRRHAFAVIVTDLKPPLPVHWGLRLGDVAANYRAALDHLAWALVGRGKTPPSTLKENQLTQIAFPISRDSATFNIRIRTALPGVRRADIGVVRRYQPYQADQRRRGEQCLSILAALNNFDKHRELQPTLMLPVGVRYKIREYRDCVKSRKVKPVGKTFALEVGTELGILPVRKTGPNPEVDVEPFVSTLVGMDNGIALVTWFDNTRAWIGTLLREFAEPPKKALNEVAAAL